MSGRKMENAQKDNFAFTFTFKIAKFKHKIYLKIKF